MARVSSIKGLGPAFEAECARAGIETAEELRALGAHEAYARMVRAGTRPHFIGYYALTMVLMGRPWNDCRGAEKEALRARFDALRAARAADPDGLPEALARALDQIGVRGGKRG